ncbi:metal-dependent hydrolase [Natronosalvus halobius]|uniref:metal-dependent hydrolase n=1 Tax=Natronosalvus halobius TaxID=2953746 RepID=UPI00209F48EA|nr:metal-dependent hydrolase [Natronosalvus halobius]USZ71504.1 metal-dependent hydrolase [Natronosalvus halobius]
MADLLAHVLVAYACFTVLGWRLEWLTRRWLAVGLVGSLLPDLNRIELIVSDTATEAALGVPLEFDAIHTLGGVVLLAVAGTLCFRHDHRRAFGMLFAGALSHLALDALKVYADGFSGVWLYPLSWYRHPSPNLYVSSEPIVLFSAIVVATAVWWMDRSFGF